MNNHENGFKRIARIRKEILTKRGRIHSFDESLACPEQFKSRGIRALIHLAKHLDELAENCSDISGLTERLTRNFISSGDKSDMAQVIASAIGRVVSAQLNIAGFAVHKAAGAGLYTLSTLVSLGVLALIRSKNVELRSSAAIEQAMQKSSFDSSAYLLVARKLLRAKEALLTKLLNQTGTSGNKAGKSIRKWGTFMSRHRRLVPEHMMSKRKMHRNYIWNNLHQYGPVTRALMHVGYGTFQGVNKVLASYDKHSGTAIGNFLLRRKTGQILGCRLGLTLTVSCAAALSVPMYPLIIGISTAGAIACGVAFSALALAKLNVYVSHDWKGNICKPDRY